MIEIIKHGNTRKQIECLRCHCVFMFTKEDIIYALRKNLASTVICPECLYNVNISNAKEVETK